MEKEWYVVNTYSGHENKVKEKLEMRASTMGMEEYIHRVVVPAQKEVIVKMLVVMIVGIMLIVMSTNVFAATGTGRFWDDVTNDVDQNLTADPVEPEPEAPVVETNTNNYNTNIPDAGATENTIVGIAVISLSIVAIFAYSKMKYYKNI